jgi:hypothetical protein
MITLTELRGGLEFTEQDHLFHMAIDMDREIKGEVYPVVVFITVPNTPVYRCDMHISQSLLDQDDAKHHIASRALRAMRSAK